MICRTTSAGGALAVPEGDSTVEVANALIDWSPARGEPIVASRDWHPADHGSFASQHRGTLHLGDPDGPAQTFWPDHCVQHSEGAALHPLLKQKAIAAVFHKGQNRVIDSYSAFLTTVTGRKLNWTAGCVVRGSWS